jgi:hypothetical protein
MSIHQTQDLLGAHFLAVAVVISQMVGQTRKSLAAATAREHEAIRLYELSAVLSGLHDDEAIVQALARQIKETFLPQRVDVILEVQAGTQPVYFGLSERPIPPGSRPALLVPLQSVRGLLGEIRLWRQVASFPEEERLLRFAARPYWPGADTADAGRIAGWCWKATA